jgi:hypothetical protein
VGDSDSPKTGNKTKESELKTMIKDHGRRFAGIRKRTLAMAAMTLVVPTVALASASPAMAEPKGIFKIFNQCPTEVPGVTLCNYNQTTSGEFKLGTTTVPIKGVTITQQGGYIPTGNPENEREFFGIPAKNGESISKTALNVPGGLLDLIDCEEIKGTGGFEEFVREACKKTFEHGATEVTATTELVANEKDPVIFNEEALGEESGTAVTLPIRVHLKNTFLGNSCYIGSESSPIKLHLTTGATSLASPPAGWKSIHGALGKIETLKEDGLRSLRVKNNSLVDNTFAAPGTEGCGEIEFFGYKYTGFLDSLVNGKIGVPNKAGENTAILDGELAAASAEAVIESEGI